EPIDSPHVRALPVLPRAGGPRRRRHPRLRRPGDRPAVRSLIGAPATMPITLDPSLPPSLYPLAWLVGTWEGSGAVHLPGNGSDGDRRIEQRLECVPREDGTLQWSSRIHVIDDPAPLPPTSVFSRDEAPTAPAGTGERSLLMREDGIWTVGEPLPGQDLRAAREAEPGSEQSLVSYAVTAQ